MAVSNSHFRTVPLSWRAELRLGFGENERTRSVTLQIFRRGHKGEMQSGGPVLQLFADVLPDVLSALTEAAAILETPKS